MTGAVVHYVPRWLPLSEQFVAGLVRRSARPAVVVARHGVENLEAFPQDPLVRLDRVLRPLPHRLHRQATGALLAGVVRRHRGAVLHVHFGLEVLGVVGAARRAGVPLVLSVWGHDVTARSAESDPALRRALTEADAVVVPSRFLAARAAELGATRVRVLPTGIDLDALTPSPLPGGPPTAVFVGRLVEKKGLDVLARAWPSVVARVPEAHLLVLGAGPVPVPDRAEHWRPDPSRRQEQVLDALRRATVVVTPSRTAADGDSESLLFVNLEAQAVGRPVVSTRHGGIPEFVTAESALLVPESDAGALADALVAVLTDRGRAEAMGRAGSLVAQRFSADACARKVDDLYTELLA